MKISIMMSDDDNNDNDDVYEYEIDDIDEYQTTKRNISCTFSDKSVKGTSEIELKNTDLKYNTVLNQYDVPLHIKNLLIRQFKNCILEGYDVSLYQDNITQWILQLDQKHIDKDSLLYKDMHTYNIPNLVIEINYPVSYPNNPPYCRMIKPMFVFRTGHVLIDGAICNEILTDSKWSIVIQPDQLFKLIASFLVEGEGRIDSTNLKGMYPCDTSRSAFKRMLETHGW